LALGNVFELSVVERPRPKPRASAAAGL